ncbi:MAG: MFS transporter [Betaproteobacteria bacterium]
MNPPGLAGTASPGFMSGRAAVLVFLAFALGYFLSAVVRTVIATLSPALTQEFGLQAADLGLLGGGFFLGFASTQLLLGSWLDRYGPRRVLIGFLAVAVLACLAFSMATGFAGLLAARVLLGVGLSACLMAPLTGFRRWYDPGQMLRANSWILMVGSLGMVAATLPVQWLLPLTGWRPLFWVLAVLLVLTIILLMRLVPRHVPHTPDPAGPVG